MTAVTTKQMQLVVFEGREDDVLQCVGWKIPLGLFKEVMVKGYFQKLDSLPISSLAGSAIAPSLPTALLQGPSPKPGVHFRVQTL